MVQMSPKQLIATSIQNISVIVCILNPPSKPPLS